MRKTVNEHLHFMKYFLRLIINTGCTNIVKMPSFCYSYMLVMFSLISLKSGICEEPQCQRYYMEERILEKIMSIDLKLEHTAVKIKDLGDNQQCKKKNSVRFDTPLTSALRIEDLETDGWQMVFRATSSIGHNVFNAWTTGKGSCDVKPVTMERSYACHYRNSVITDWSNLGIKYVKYAFFDTDREVAHVIFDGVGSNIITWFDKSRVISASWSDLTSMHEYNFFSMKGYHERRFHINRAYNGCDEHTGHMIVIDTDTPLGCDWDRHPVYPQFLYSQINSVDYWNRRFGRADYMAIYLKTE
ncbi:uncharacterized protein LOC123553290 isoform X2 [Mercenaria mercenaria]|uniref:uncharacterized protein LOC123553290 isoform X2 n=1 Tax=Mercenaria mercenaria TaxID=6596 RepID=UPI00234EA2E2|nr:uncharacterized protein LOC123553290 isoform X2 [Mercenaria mercenaria]